MKNVHLNKFCEQILLGKSLQEKLSYPENVILNSFSEYKHLPAVPGRPPELEFNTDKSMKLPSVHLLEQERNRGILLHFFLNHELLALEIMALTLLKFPDLPDSFKRGMLKTMKEEQLHAGLYLNRMADLGVETGDVYVNSFFWDCLKNMSSPEQYVTSMSLTFEQANLDFSLFYKNAFETCGDKKTAAVMNRVYQDEISHVSFGLKWLKKWKKPGLSDWQEYVSGLEFPLSPARAKGQFFDVEGRKKAGLSKDFIEQLEVTSFSRGRTPDIYIFNAFTESFIAQPNGFNRPEWGVQLEEDLSLLPLVLSGQDDLLYTFRDISVNHLKKLKNCGFELPQIVSVQTGEALKKLEHRSPGRLKPWGWSPEMNRVLSSLIKQNPPVMKWEEKYKNLFSKQWSSHLNRELHETEFSWLEKEESFGVFCQSAEEVCKRFKVLKNCGFTTACIKTPFGASGRNIMRFPDCKISDSQIKRVANLLKKQGGLIVEPWLERLADFSVHFEMQDHLKFLGVTQLINDEHGQYSGSLFGKFQDGLSREVLECIHRQSRGGLVSYYKSLQPLLEARIKESGYRGPVGIDSFVYKEVDGSINYRPVVEVNFRFTMGRIALELEKKLSRGKCGLFKIFSIFSEREREASDNLVKFKNEKLVFNKQGKWIAGKCLFNEWHDQIKFPMTISIGDSLEECYAGLN